MWTHQVLEQGRELFGQSGELDKGRAQIRIIPTDEVTPKLIQRLCVRLLILNVIWT